MKPQKQNKKKAIIRHGKDSISNIRICPNCGSIDIEILNITKQYAFAFGLPTAYKCRSCGFSSHIFPEVSEDELNKLKNRKKRTN